MPSQNRWLISADAPKHDGEKWPMTTTPPSGYRSPDVLLREMLDCIALIQQYVLGQTEEDFRLNQEKQDAVVRRLEILGEASTQLSAEWKARHPEASWRVIADMRNRLIHGYFSIDTRIIWQTITHDLAPLDQELRRILDSEYPPFAP